MMRRAGLAAALAGMAIAGAVVFGVQRSNGPDPVVYRSARRPADAAQIRRGAYLAVAGNCAGCHTARGGVAYAGGTGIATPFGTVYATNLTPDAATGIGAWGADDFWRALHDGRSRDGRLLYPAFPYPNYSRVTRDDADALFAYLSSLPPVVRPAVPNTLRFPYRLQAALRVWRALYFRPVKHRNDPARAADWNRGAYLVQGLTHCDACHGARNRWGAVTGERPLGGGLIPVQNWYAPALDAPDEAGVADWPLDRIVELLRTGRTRGASVAGPMADVVYRSTQYLNDADLRAMAVYLKQLPVQPAAVRVAGAAAEAAFLQRGALLYRRHCAECHGESGQGAENAYPPLAGSRAVTLASPANLVKMVVGGAFLPSTAGNPRPYGMPPFGPVLDDAETADVVSYIRGAWGNRAAPVSTLEVMRLR